MTLLFGCLSVLLSVALAAGASLVGQAALLDARVQLAADATALAAVAEWGPGGAGLPEASAREYAALNGAELVQCICSPGGNAVQVTVAIEGATGRARAEIDASLFGPAGAPAGEPGLHPAMGVAVARLLEAASGAVHVVSGYRDSEDQARLWTEAIATYGDPEVADDWVARPGHSMHERGLAVDLGGDLALAVRLIARMRLPLVRPLPHEPHHFELEGVQGRPS